jgi:hypothetical protein
LQHPFGHELASHTQRPVLVLHRCPVPHAVQLVPSLPHEAFVSEVYATQVPPAAQQPAEHDVASHTHCPVVLLHSLPAGQAAQDAPAAPQEPLFSLARASQVPALQHPAHELPPQPHVPLAHAWPEAHPPHVAPPVPHWLEDCEA